MSLPGYPDDFEKVFVKVKKKKRTDSNVVSLGE